MKSIPIFLIATCIQFVMSNLLADSLKQLFHNNGVCAIESLIQKKSVIEVEINDDSYSILSEDFIDFLSTLKKENNLNRLTIDYELSSENGQATLLIGNWHFRNSKLDSVKIYLYFENTANKKALQSIEIQGKKMVISTVEENNY